MPPEIIDRKELKPSLSESDVTVGWKDMPLTPSSCRWPASQPFSGHGKGVGEERRTSPNGGFNSQVEFVNSWGELNSVGEKRGLEKGNSLDWKPVKWIRSGSLSSRGSGFSHSSSFDNKMEGQLGGGVGGSSGGGSFLQSPVGEAAACVTPNTPDESSRKKARLGWGEGLAKYEKKKVDPDDVVDKEVAVNSSCLGGYQCLYKHP